MILTYLFNVACASRSSPDFISPEKLARMEFKKKYIALTDIHANRRNPCVHRNRINDEEKKSQWKIEQKSRLTSSYTKNRAS